MKLRTYAPPAGKRFAANLSIELTTRCTGACPYCFARAALSGEASLTPECARMICAEGYAAGFRHLHLTGGEPLLWEGLFDLLDEALEIGYQSVFLNTNGLLMTDDVAVRLSRYPGLRLSVSLQGPEILHDAMRGAGSFRRATRGISRALDAGVALSIFTAVGKTLLGQLPAFAKELYEHFHGIERFTLIQLIRVRDDVCDLTAELLAPDDFVKLVRMISALNLCGYITVLLNNPLANVVAAKLQLPLVPTSHPLCRPDKLVVRANRDITLAHSTWKSFGKFAPGVIARLLVHDGFRKAVAPDDRTCPTCRYRDVCRDNGMRHSSTSAVDMHPEIPYCQRVLAGIASELPAPQGALRSIQRCSDGSAVRHSSTGSTGCG